MENEKFEQLPPHYLTPKKTENKPKAAPKPEAPKEDGFLAILVIEKAPNNEWEYNPIFRLGRIVATPEALTELDSEEMIDLLIGHADLEAGELSTEDQQANVLAVKNGERILSCFKVKSTQFYVITKHDRSLTTMMLREEY